MPTFRSITVAELRELLEGQDDDTLVTFASNYGDYSRTQQVHSLSGDIEELPIEESGYSDSGWAVASEDSDDDEDRPTVLVIS